MSEAGNTLTYWYGIVGADAPEAPDALAGLDGMPVRAVDAGGLRAIVSHVPADAYSEAALDANLTSIEWTGSRGVAHERVLTWFADRTPVIPLAPFSLHQDDARVRERLEDAAGLFRRALDRIAGHREWIVRVWRLDDRFAKAVDDSPTLRSLVAEANTASPGRRHLIEKKLATLRAEETRRLSAARASEIFDALRGPAADAQRLPVAQLPEGRRTAGRTLMLAAAYFVPEADYEAFEREIQVRARNAEAEGLEWEFTGPWPAYHFSAVE